MATLKFSDGQSFELDSKPHIEQRADGLYVVGNGFLVPCSTQEEADDILRTMTSPSKNKITLLPK